MSEVRAQQFLQKAVNAGKFGDAEIVGFFSDKTEGEDQFASQVAFVGMKIKRRREDIVKVVVKMRSEFTEIQEWMDSGIQFYNEALMYEEILPYLEQNGIVRELFPQFYHANATLDKRPSEDVVIVKDLRGSGFRLSTERLCLDYDHASLTLTNLGRFHALSYAAKQRDYKQFQEHVTKLKEQQYLDRKQERINVWWANTAERGIYELYKKPEYKTVLEELRSAVTEDIYKFMKSLVAPEEPMAVVCHGDFCRNNILYKYEDNKPIKVKFFDLATSRYCSPVIDISFFMFLNVPSAIRRERWDDLLGAYHEGLSSGVPGTKVPSLDDIRQEMRKKAAYGYVVCSYFFLAMIPDDPTELIDILRFNTEELGHYAWHFGDQKTTDATVTVLEDMIFKKCVKSLK